MNNSKKPKKPKNPKNKKTAEMTDITLKAIENTAESTVDESTVDESTAADESTLELRGLSATLKKILDTVHFAQTHNVRVSTVFNIDDKIDNILVSISDIYGLHINNDGGYSLIGKSNGKKLSFLGNSIIINASNRLADGYSRLNAYKKVLSIIEKTIDQCYSDTKIHINNKAIVFEKEKVINICNKIIADIENLEVILIRSDKSIRQVALESQAQSNYSNFELLVMLLKEHGSSDLNKAIKQLNADNLPKKTAVKSFAKVYDSFKLFFRAATIKELEIIYNSYQAGLLFLADMAKSESYRPLAKKILSNWLDFLTLDNYLESKNLKKDFDHFVKINEISLAKRDQLLLISSLINDQLSSLIDENGDFFQLAAPINQYKISKNGEILEIEKFSEKVNTIDLAKSFMSLNKISKIAKVSKNDDNEMPKIQSLPISDSELMGSLKALKNRLSDLKENESDITNLNDYLLPIFDSIIHGNDISSSIENLINAFYK